MIGVGGKTENFTKWYGKERGAEEWAIESVCIEAIRRVTSKTLVLIYCRKKLHIWAICRILPFSQWFVCIRVKTSEAVVWPFYFCEKRGYSHLQMLNEIINWKSINNMKKINLMSFACWDGIILNYKLGYKIIWQRHQVLAGILGGE